MTTDNNGANGQHRTHLYVGIAGEGPLIAGIGEPRPLGGGGLYRQAHGEDDWHSITNGLPAEPQVRALLVHPQNPAVVFAGTQAGVFRSDDRGERWQATDSPDGDVWSLAVHPQNPNVMYAGYDQCVIARSDDGGATWKKGNTKDISFPHITMNPYQICKRVIGLSIDAHNPQDVYGAIEVGGLVASRDGGDNWQSITDGHYTRTGPVDLHGVQVNPKAPGLVYIITQLAMFRSRNHGQQLGVRGHRGDVPRRQLLPGPGGGPRRPQYHVPGGRGRRRQRPPGHHRRPGCWCAAGTPGRPGSGLTWARWPPAACSRLP